MHTYFCPKCFGDVPYERFTDDVFACPSCGTRCRSEHDCHYDSESGEESCSDWLELVGEGE